MPYEELRRDPDLARELLSDMLGVRGFRSVAKILARTIERVHLRAPYAWELTLSPKYLRLNVGQDAMAEVVRGSLYLYCLNRQTSLPTGFVRERGFGGYADIDGIVERWRIDVTKIDAVPPSFIRAHSSAASQAANAKQRSPWKGSHSPSAVKAIATAAAQILPQPAYALVSSDSGFDVQATNGGRSVSPPNPEIERTAVVAANGYYRSRGWRVQSVERDRCGFDLLCEKGAKRIHVEVKGHSGRPDRFVMTAGEMHRAVEDHNFLLFVCYNIASGANERLLFPRDSVLKEYLATPTEYVLARRAPAAI